MNQDNHIAQELFAALSKGSGEVAVIDYGLPSPVRVERGVFLVLALLLARELRTEIREDRVGWSFLLAWRAYWPTSPILAGKIPVNLNFTLGAEAIAHSMEEAEIRTVLTAHAMTKKFLKFPWPEGWLDAGEKLKVYRKNKIGDYVRLICFGCFEEHRKTFSNLAREVPGKPRFFSPAELPPAQGVVLPVNLLANCDQISRTGFDGDSSCWPTCLFHSFGFTIATIYPLLEGPVVCAPSPLDRPRACGHL